MQKSLTKFVENRPKVAEELGITSLSNNAVSKSNKCRITIDSDSEEEQPKTKRNSKKNCEDDDYVPDTFTALVGSNRTRRSSNAVVVPEPVVVKPKLRRVEKKFVPVLEKLSIEELMETNTYDRFNRTIESVLKTFEELDMNEICK